MCLHSAEIQKRAPLWQALSILFVDVELKGHDFEHVASVVVESGFSPGDVYRILWAEVFPALAANLESAAGEWSAFPDAWLQERITTVLADPTFERRGHGLRNRAARKIVADAWSEVCKLLPPAYREYSERDG